MSANTLYKRFPLRIIFDIITFIYLFFTLRFKELWALIRAYFSFLGRWRQTHSKRKQLLASRSQTKDPSIMSNFSIVWNYFIRRRKYYSELED